MPSDFVITSEGRVVGARIRLGWLGRPVVQIQREVRRHRLVGPPPDGEVSEPWGRTQWRDAKRRDAIEVAAFVSGLREKASETDMDGNPIE